MALEVGAFQYATGVLENWLKYYVRRNGTTTYNHVGMTALGRELTVFAQYYRCERGVAIGVVFAAA